MMAGSSGSDGEQRYAPGYEPGITDLFRFRNAERFSRHLLVHLRPGIRVLHGGCGPGTITVGLARHVAPGLVLGIDRDGKQITAATTAAQQVRVRNVRFEAGEGNKPASMEIPTDSLIWPGRDSPGRKMGSN